MVNLDDFKPNIPAKDKKLVGTIIGLQVLGLETCAVLEYAITKNPIKIAEAIAYAYYGAEMGLSLYKDEAFPIARFVYDNSKKAVRRIKDTF
jgi:hypothetical protein